MKYDDFIRFVPVASLIVSTGSFVFALTVLYPWHRELSEQMLHLQETCGY
jgi:hypothetical protein